MTPSLTVQAQLRSQGFGVFLPDHGLIGEFNVPPLPPDSFFDIFTEISLADLPPPPQKILPGGGPVAAPIDGGPTVQTHCPPDTNWAGNVDLIWSGPGGSGQVFKHYGDLLVCPGAGPSYIHVRTNTCPVPAPWMVTGICPGFFATLVNEDFSPAPNPVPAGWTGWICVSAPAGTPAGVSCCFNVDFSCAGSPATIEICATTCDWAPPRPVLADIDWANLTPSTVRFQLRWENPDPNHPSAPISGTVMSQPFGVFVPDHGLIGPFNVPPLPPDSFFDIFFEIDRVSLPPPPQKILPGGGPIAASIGGGGAEVLNDCPPDTTWAGNVDISWGGPGGGTVETNYHFTDLLICPGAGPSYVHALVFCGAATGATWSVTGLCPGFTASLVNEDFTPAPNPVPPGWTGWICVSAAAGVPSGLECCLKIEFLCDGAPGVINVCAKTCNWAPRPPVLTAVDWTTIGPVVQFRMRWENPSMSGPTDPLHGMMNSQPFGVFMPDFGPIGDFDVPPIMPESFFDVFVEIPMAQLPPEPQEIMPGGGPEPGSPCPPDDIWDGNVDIVWGEPGTTGQVNYHFGDVLVCPAGGPTYIHVLTFCNSPLGAMWSIAGLCPGFKATLVNEDFSPAPNPVPPGWTGWICVEAEAGIAYGTECCFTVRFLCDGAPARIEMCATACRWTTTDVPTNPTGVEFGVYSASPNPSTGAMLIGFAVPRSGPAKLEVFDAAGKRTRVLFDGEAAAGNNSVRWDGRGEKGAALPPGAYFVRLTQDGKINSRKVALIH
jgi:hypothetical protein